ncbi:MAG: ROK family protein [Pseudomonadota bacterium]
MTTPAIGIDLGGTKTEIAVLDENGAFLLRRRVPTVRGDYDATIEAITALVEGAEAELGTRCTVGIGHPGSISPRTGLIRNANSTWLNGRRLGVDLETRLARPAAFANDANCLALSEATDGAGAGARAVFAVILGTGCGGGLVVDGQVLGGHNGIGGEWGHNPLPWPEPDELPGPACWCGLHGCQELWLSGTGLEHYAAEVIGTAVAAPAVVARAASGDEPARAVLDRYNGRLARGLAAVINLFDPDVIVLGGGVSNVDELYASVPARWQRHTFADSIDTPLRKARHGDSSGVRGAAWLGRDMRR